jgi:hypothetical protein
MYPVLHAALGKSILRPAPGRAVHVPPAGISRLAIAFTLALALAAAGGMTASPERTVAEQSGGSALR